MKNFEPKSFIQGETLHWQRCFDDYTAANGWTITYYFRGTGKGFDVVAAADSNVSVPSAVTAQMSAGLYSWQAFAVKNLEKILLDSGTAEVKPGLAAVGVETTFDGRTENRKILDAIRAMIAKKATLDQQEYAIGNRQLKRIPLTDLIALESRYVGLVAREKQAERLRKGGKLFKKVLVRLK